MEDARPQISVPELMAIIGDKEVQLMLFQKQLSKALARIAELEAAAAAKEQ